MAGPLNPQNSNKGEEVYTGESVAIVGADALMEEVDGEVEKDRIRVVCFTFPPRDLESSLLRKT